MADGEDEGGAGAGKGKRHLPIVDGPIRTDLDDGLRFVHVMNMQVKHDLFEASARLGALVEELVVGGLIDPVALEERRARIKQRDADEQRSKAHVLLGEQFDKYTMTGLPDVPCAELIPICKGRCCKQWFALSYQDLDEGVVEWDYGLPYVVRKRADGYCVHSDEKTRSCQVYDQRPANCRKYDCREDKRIWLDFERRIPAPIKS